MDLRLLRRRVFKIGTLQENEMKQVYFDSINLK